MDVYWGNLEVEISAVEQLMELQGVEHTLITAVSAFQTMKRTPFSPLLLR